MHSKWVRLVVFGAGDGCSTRINEVGGGLTQGALYDSGFITPCDFRAGAAEVPSLETRSLNFVVVAADTNQISIMHQGCTIANPATVRDNGLPVVVTLRPTSYYDDQYNLARPPCANVEEQCSGACTAP